MEHKEQSIRDENQQLQEQLQDPDVYSRSDYPVLAKRQGELARAVALFDDKKSILSQIAGANQIISEDSGEMAEMAREELVELQAKLESVDAAISEELLPKDPNDERDAVVEIRAAAGGDEAALFAGDLYRMYSRYAEKSGFKVELLAESPAEAGGYKEIIFMMRGTEVYKTMKFEAGVHRVQRIPVTESQGRIHTSTVTVAVLPEAEEKDVQINQADLKIDVFRSSGPGGQSVNTTDSAVRITHVPTGIVVSMQDEKSQIKNKERAMGVLRSRILQAQIEEQQKESSDARSKLIGSGDRSEKIRTYNFPQDRITDHRINYSRSNLPGALDGNIDDIIEQLQAKELELLKGE
jgi:peptide chain release factor 1